MVLAGTRNDTEYTAIVTQLRSAWDDQDLRALWGGAVLGDVAVPSSFGVVLL